MERECEKDIDEIQIRKEKKQALKIMSEFVKYLKSHNTAKNTRKMTFPYSYFELDSLQIEDFITAALPDLLDSLSAPIFLLLLGEINIEKAIRLVDTEILGEGGKE